MFTQDFIVIDESLWPSILEAEALTRLATRCLQEFRTFVELIEEKLCPKHHGRHETLITCWRRNELVGAAAIDVHVMHQRRIGGVRLLLIDPMWRRRGVGSMVLKAAETRLLMQGVSRIWLYCSLPNYLFPGAPKNDLSIACFADKLGYRSIAQTRDVSVDLERMRTWSAPGRYQIRSVAAVGNGEGREELYAFASKEFPGFKAEVERALRWPDPIAYIAYDGPIPIGFCVAGSNNLPLGAVGPAAVLREYRGRDVFRCLVQSCMRELKNRGYRFARMQWADSRAPAFHRKWFDGFICDEYIIYGKDVSPSAQDVEMPTLISSM